MSRIAQPVVLDADRRARRPVFDPDRWRVAESPKCGTVPPVRQLARGFRPSQCADPGRRRATARSCRARGCESGRRSGVGTVSRLFPVFYRRCATFSERPQHGTSRPEGRHAGVTLLRTLRSDRAEALTQLRGPACKPFRRLGRLNTSSRLRHLAVAAWRTGDTAGFKGAVSSHSKGHGQITPALIHETRPLWCVQHDRRHVPIPGLFVPN
jgi:hypothetical protein